MRSGVLLFICILFGFVGCVAARGEPRVTLKATGVRTCDFILDPDGRDIIAAQLTVRIDTPGGSITNDSFLPRTPWSAVGMNIKNGNTIEITLMTDPGSGPSGPMLSYTSPDTARRAITLEDWSLTDSQWDSWEPGFDDRPPTVVLGNRLEFRTAPSGAEAGRILRPAPEVQLLTEDAAGCSGYIYLSLAATDPPGAVLRGTLFVRPVDGVAVFPAVSIDRPGSYVLQASAGEYVGDSQPFQVVNPPPYTMGDASHAVQVAAGLSEGTAEDHYRYNAHWDPGASQKIDLLDAIAIARKLTGLDGTGG